MPIAPKVKKSDRLELQAELKKDLLYALGGGRILYAFPTFHQTKPIRRFSAQILLTYGAEPAYLTVNGESGRYRAAIIKPRAERMCRANHGFGFQVDPSHPAFPRFRTIPDSGILSLDRDSFHRFQASFDLAYRGKLSAEQASDLFDGVLEIALTNLPAVPPLDTRVRRVLDLLKANPQFPLQELAKNVGLSYYRLSHLFAEQIGLPLRSFQLWRKVNEAMRLIPGTNIREAARLAGFVDPAHLSHAFEQLHSAVPSYFIDSNYVTIIARTNRDTKG